MTSVPDKISPSPNGSATGSTWGDTAVALLGETPRPHSLPKTAVDSQQQRWSKLESFRVCCHPQQHTDLVLLSTHPRLDAIARLFWMSNPTLTKHQKLTLNHL